MSDTTNALALDKPLLRSLLVMGAIVEACDVYAGGHLWRVSQYARLLAEKAGLSPHEVFLAAISGFLHDVGNIAISDAILNKRDRLDDSEYAMVKTHPMVGHDLLREHPLGSLALDAVSHHHERYDGQGYPRQRVGEETPLIARIIAIADAFDAMTSARAYRPRMSVARALTIVREEQGRQFDPALCTDFLALAAAGVLEPIVGHSFHQRPLAHCPLCGPVIVVEAAAVEGSRYFCRACNNEYRLYRNNHTWTAECTGQRAMPEQVRPQVDPDPIEELLADSAPRSTVKLVAAMATAARILLIQADAEQTELWRSALKKLGLVPQLFPADSDLKIALRIMDAERDAPDLVLIDVACFLTHHADPYAFAGWLARWLPGVRLLLTNSAASRINDSARAQALRRGAMDLLPELPADPGQPQFQAALNAVNAALRQSPRAMADADAGTDLESSGPLSDAARILIALRGPGGVSIRDRSYRLKVYPRCFIGTEAVDWLCRTFKVSPQEALKFGSDLVARRVIHHVVDDHDFKNERLFYRFIVDEIPEIA